LKNIFHFASELSSVSRYSRTHLVKPESVLEHIGFMNLLCYHIYTIVVGAGNEVDLGTLMAKATVHDYDEWMTGDVERPTKHSSSEMEAVFKKLEAQAVGQLTSTILDSSVYGVWAQSKDDSTEGFIVSIADAFAVAFKAWEEHERFGCTTLKTHANDLIPRLDQRVTEAHKHFDNPAPIQAMIYSVISICKEIGEKK
jgi:5'-deoxynucleotidase YfbR-like HD superfamily hydrolase